MLLRRAAGLASAPGRLSSSSLPKNLSSSSYTPSLACPFSFNSSILSLSNIQNQSTTPFLSFSTPQRHFSIPTFSSSATFSLSASSTSSSLFSHNALSASLLSANQVRFITSADAALAKRAKVDMQVRFADKIKKYKPVTPGVRHLVLLDRSELHKGKPVYRLTVAKRSKAGRSKGTIAVRHRGGGHKRRYRIVDFKRTIEDVVGKCERLEYDPNRNAHLALIRYENFNPEKISDFAVRSADKKDVLQYIIAPQKFGPGDTVVASRTKEIEVRPGNAMPLHRVPIGTKVHCVELLPKKGAQVSRSAGTFCQLLEKQNTGRKNHALVRICSKETRLIPLDSLVTIGEVSNPLHKLIQLGKAGRSRWMGIRPTVRGLAMNPVDHAHGGGGAKGREGRPSCSPNGLLAKGFKTRRKRKNSQLIVVPRGGVKKAGMSV